MTDLPADPVPDPPDLEPGSLASAEFARARKGFEPSEVRALLGRAADALRAWHERDARLVARLDELERRLDQSRELDEQRITTVLGEETARIVAAAREAATEIRSNAEEHAARLIQESEESAAASAAALTDEAAALKAGAEELHAQAVADAEALRSEAQDHADRVRAEASAEHDSLLASAKTILGERTAEAEAAAAGIREAAQIELDTAHADGLRLREEAREAAAAEVERARAEGRTMVDEARQLRRQMLQDLAERRRTARRQIEAARAGRDRIVEALGAAGDRVADVVAELSDVDALAQRAADGAAASVDDDIDSVVAELETGLTFGGLDVRTDSGTDEVGTRTDGPARAVSADAEVEETVGDATEPAEVDASVAIPSEPESEDVSEPTDQAGPGETAEVVDVSLVAADVEGEPSPGATVHDLFERIRAERRSEAEGHPSLDDTDLGDIDLGDIDLEDADLDDADLDDADPDDDAPRGDDDASELASVVVLEQPDDPEADPADEGSSDATVIDATVIDTTAVEVVPPGGSGGKGGVTLVEEIVVSETVVLTTVAEDDVDGVRAATSALDRRDELLGSVEKSLARSLKRLVSDEQNEVLDRLRRIRRGRPDLDVLLPDGDDAVAFTAALRKDFGAAAAAGARFWLAESGGDEATADELVDADVVDGGLEMRVGELLGLRRAHIQRTLEHAEGSGADIAELGDSVRAAYREWRTRSVPDLAGDLAASGFALGEQAAAGDGTSWCWMVDNGGLPCSDAEDNALAGPTGCGSAFPTGDVIPPAHSGCRCILVPPPR